MIFSSNVIFPRQILQLLSKKAEAKRLKKEGENSCKSNDILMVAVLFDRYHQLMAMNVLFYMI